MRMAGHIGHVQSGLDVLFIRHPFQAQAHLCERHASCFYHNRVCRQALQEEALLSFSSGQRPFEYNWSSLDMMQAHHTSSTVPVFE